MKILIISNIFPPGFIGGYELGAYDVATSFQQQGHQVRVLTSDYLLDEKQEIVNFKVDRILEWIEVDPRQDWNSIVYKGQFINIRNIRLLNNVLNDFQPDSVVCFNLLGLGVLGILHYLVSLNFKPICYLMFNLFYLIYAENKKLFCQYNEKFGLIEEFLQKVRFISMSECLTVDIQKALGFILQDIHLIPGWYLEHTLPSSLLTNDINADSYLNDSVKFIFASRISEPKGIFIVLEAVKIIIEKYNLTNFSVDIYGAGEITLFLQKVAIQKLDKWICYCGSEKKEQICKLFAKYDALLFPTWGNEPFGFVVAEAAAAKCVPIITATIGAAEWFMDGLDCYKIQRNPESLARAMIDYLKKNNQERNTIKLYAQKTALKYFKFSHLFKKITKLTEQVSIKENSSFYKDKGQEMAMTILEDLWSKGDDLI